MEIIQPCSYVDTDDALLRTAYNY